MASNKLEKKKEFKNNSLESIKNSNNCKISEASNEIMLDRIYNGSRIEFPFSQ